MNAHWKNVRSWELRYTRLPSSHNFDRLTARAVHHHPIIGKSLGFLTKGPKFHESFKVAGPKGRLP